MALTESILPGFWFHTIPLKGFKRKYDVIRLL